MKSLPDSEDDMFGPPRTYSTGYCHTPPRNRPSMISAKYRAKEERRKVLKISVNKLRKIEDPEASLCRSVLINNTMKRLQKEAKDEKGHLQQSPSVVLTDFAIDTDDLVPTELTYGSRKRPAEEVDDCDVQDVLSQFYMPPTPRMLTSIDDDDDGGGGGSGSGSGSGSGGEQVPEVKRPKYEDRAVPEELQVHVRHPAAQTPVTTASSFSCGHASMFNELQNNVFHSLVASLET